MDFEKNGTLECMDENTTGKTAQPQPPRQPSKLKARLRGYLETIIFGWLIIALCALLFSAAQWLASELSLDFPIVPILAGGMMLLLIALLLRKNGDDILTGMVDDDEEEDL